MNDSERILGRLEEFKDHTSQRLDKIEHKIDILHEFKWRVAGGAAVLSVITTLVVQLFKYWSKGDS